MALVVSISSNIPSIFIPLFIYHSFKINDTSRWDLELVLILLFINFVEVFFQSEYKFFKKSNSIYSKFCAKNPYFGQYFKNLTEILYFSKFHFKFWDKTLSITWILRNSEIRYHEFFRISSAKRSLFISITSIKSFFYICIVRRHYSVSISCNDWFVFLMFCLHQQTNGVLMNKSCVNFKCKRVMFKTL